MKLHWSPLSPYVRKVMIVLHETGQLGDVDCVRSVVGLADTPNPAVLADNPLAKIPTLITDDGLNLFDSRVICEYLDARGNGGLFPAEGTARHKALRWQSLGDGVTDILLLWRTELTRPTGPWHAITDGWLVKVRASMAQLEAEAGELREAQFGIGHISIICALGQMDFRWPDCDWRAHFPTLATLNQDWLVRPSISLTRAPADQPQDSHVTEGNLYYS
ncbi:MAG: glutathione S-transferase [Silicimonas sp.]|nr:glutathione S-transferase [Silicimonas sp.]